MIIIGSLSVADLAGFDLRQSYTEIGGKSLLRTKNGTAILQSRCTDDTGYVQPTLGQLIAARGGALNGPTGSIYHLNAIQSWQVANDGKVSNVHHY